LLFQIVRKDSKTFGLKNSVILDMKETYHDYMLGFCSEIHNWSQRSTRSGKWKFVISVRLE